MRGRDLAINLGLALAGLLAVALAAELGLRTVLLRNLNPFRPDPEIGFRLKSSFEGTYPRVRVRTDAHGRRVPLHQDAAGGGRWLFIGDSVTFGFGVAVEESYPYVTGRALGDPDGVAVAAVPGYNLGQTLAVLEENLELAVPELVVVGLVVNDLGSAAHPASYEDIDPHAARAARGGLFARSMLVSFIERRLQRVAASFEPPRESAAGLADVADFDLELPAADRVAFDAQWAQLQAVQRRVGRPFYVLICPYRQQVESPEAATAFQRFAVARCGEGPLRCLDPLEWMRQHAAEELFNGDSSYHYNERGHALLGAWLSERLR